MFQTNQTKTENSDPSLWNWRAGNWKYSQYEGKSLYDIIKYTEVVSTQKKPSFDLTD